MKISAHLNMKDQLQIPFLDPYLQKDKHGSQQSKESTNWKHYIKELMLFLIKYTATGFAEINS